MASNTNLLFDPDRHVEDTLKAFNEYIEIYSLRYDAKYPDPPKVSMDAALTRWQFTHPDEKPSLQQYDIIRDGWRFKDMVTKFLGLFSSPRMFADWNVAEPNEEDRKIATWASFVSTIRNFYKPTENMTLKNFKFRSLAQNHEAFNAFCNRVTKEAKHCDFKCDDMNCTAEDTAIRDQVIIGTTSDKIREEALKNSWDMSQIRKNGMQIESATRGAAELSGETSINKLGRYSYKNQNRRKPTGRACFFCGHQFEKYSSINDHVRTCKARTSTCSNCKKIGHYETVCKSKSVREIKEEINDNEYQRQSSEPTPQPLYNINIFRISEHSFKHNNKKDFMVEVIINNSLAYILADTGASISVCGAAEAKRWRLWERMYSSKSRIKPYNSPAIPTIGVARCAVTFGATSIPVQWHIIEGSCEPVLSGTCAKQLGIIRFNPTSEVFQPINMIDEQKNELQHILQNYPQNFKGLGKMKNYQVKLHVDPNVKPVASPPRATPYHLQERVNKAITDMIAKGVIEEHPTTQPALWVSNAVIAPKSDGAIRVTLAARNVNRAIQTSNLPIPRQEDIKAKLNNATIFSKMDFKTAF
jgi:hypothetical protein